MERDMLEHEDICAEPMPEGISIHRTILAGNLVATCKHCDYVCAYWECACELVHDCELGE